MVDTERYAASFAMLDRDGDGRVTSSEFQELMATIGVTFSDEAAVKAIEMMDTDGDGLVSLEELARYLSLPHVKVDDDITPADGTPVAEAPAPDPAD